MALIEENLLERIDKVQVAIDRLKSFEPPDGYFLAFSGGKDSQAIYHLAKMAGVKFDEYEQNVVVGPRYYIQNMVEGVLRKYYAKETQTHPKRRNLRPGPSCGEGQKGR